MVIRVRVIKVRVLLDPRVRVNPKGLIGLLELRVNRVRVNNPNPN